LSLAFTIHCWISQDLQQISNQPTSQVACSHDAMYCMLLFEICRAQRVNVALRYRLERCMGMGMPVLPR